MRLILSCLSKDNIVVNKDNLLLLVNTETKDKKWLKLKITESNDLIGTKGIGYSGDFFLASIVTNGKKDKLLVIDTVTEKQNVSYYIKSKDVHDICSVFRGRFYVCSSYSNSMNQIVLSPSTNNIIKDSFHYSFNKDIHFNCFLNWKNKWFASYYGEGWREGFYENGSIIELSSNSRKIYSNINQPNSLFFNRNDELCFLESGKKFFHFGKNIIYLENGYPRGVIEDRDECGYWVACVNEDGVSKLSFYDYYGLYSESIDLEIGYDIYSIVKAEGYLSKLL